jgi:hypothetical protein
MLCFVTVSSVQILNRTVLGSVWAGSITMWNDAAIRELNPGIAYKLPNTKIKMGYSNDTTKPLTFNEVLKLTLESFSPEFATVFAAANRTFANLPPAINGYSVRVGSSSASRITWLQVHFNSFYFIFFYHSQLFPPRKIRTALRGSTLREA